MLSERVYRALLPGLHDYQILVSEKQGDQNA